MNAAHRRRDRTGPGVAGGRKVTVHLFPPTKPVKTRSYLEVVDELIAQLDFLEVESKAKKADDEKAYDA